MYEVIEFAGMNNESQVDEFPTLKEAQAHIK